MSLAREAGGGTDDPILGIVMTAVQTVLSDPTLAPIFGAPVDIKSLPGYLDVVERPMDLRTICNNQASDYKSVLRDVRLVWQNCTAYWGQKGKESDETGKVVLEMCRRARRMFLAALDRGCRARGVRMLDPMLGGAALSYQRFVAERDEMAQYEEEEEEEEEVGGPGEHEGGRETCAGGEASGSGRDGASSFEGGSLPILDLDLFDIHTDDSEEPVDLLAMGHMRVAGETSVRVTGTMQAPRKKSTISLSLSKVKNAGAGPERAKVADEEVIDWAVGWSIGVGNMGTNNVTEDKRAAVYLITNSAWYRLHRPSETYEEVYQSVVTGVMLVELSSQRAEVVGDVPDVKGIVEAVAKEMRAGAVDGVDGNLPPRNVPAHVKKFAIGHMEALYGQRIDALSRYGLVDGDPRAALEDGRLDMEIDTEVSRQRQERGPPPEMDSRWRVPKEKVHELLYLWGFLQEFGAILKLPPFTLGTLEAALSTGPTIDMALNEVTFKAEDAKEMERIRAEAEQKGKERDGTGGRSTLAASPNPDGTSVGGGVSSLARSLATDSYGMDGPDGRGGDGPGAGGDDVGDSSAGADARTSVHPDSSAPENATLKLEGDSKVDVNAGVLADGVARTDVNEAAVKEENPQMDSSVNGMSDDASGVRRAGGGGVPAGLPTKRGRGRPRKGEPGPPIPHMPHPAPQNLIKDPTVKTRMQRGVAFNSKKFDDEFTTDVDNLFEGDVPDEDDLPAKMRRKSSFKLSRKSDPHLFTAGMAAPGPRVPTPEELAAAAKDAQRRREEQEAKVKQKYGVSLEIVEKATVIDRAYAPSGVLIRDIVLALLSVVDETLVVPRGKQEPVRPDQASTYVSRSHRLLWPAALANTVWSYEQSSEQLKTTALRLAYGDFIDLSAAERIDVLCGLVSEIIESPLLANIIVKKADDSAQFHAVRPPWRCVKPYGIDMAQGIQKDMDQRADKVIKASISGDATSTAPSISKPMAKWTSWLGLLGLGTLAPIGDDANGRRYWALGEEAGAFRVFCQEIKDEASNEDSWGWYEGERLDQLVAWLKVCDIRTERPLVAALSTAPRSTLGDSTKLIEHSRQDGYRGITSPLLRGEFNHCNTKPAALTMDQRSSRAVEIMLGTIPFWFDQELTKKIVGISDVLLKGQPSVCSKVLLEADELLMAAGKTSEEWVDLWSPNWRRTAVSMSSTLEVLLHVSAMQKHVSVEDDVLSRIVFLKLLEEMHTNQVVPLPEDDVAVSRTAALQHIDKAMQLLGIAHRAAQLPPQVEGADDANGVDEMEAAEVLGMLGDKFEEVDAISNPSAANPLVRDGAKLAGEWQALRARVAQMGRIEQYTVRCITYRKSLAGVSETQHVANASDRDLAALSTPVAWITLKPAPYALPSEMATTMITLPLVLGKDLEDFCPQAKEYKRAMRVGWMVNDRFKMKATGWAGGWKKGTVLDNYAPHNLYIPGSSESTCDPCRSILVSFDDGPEGNEERVSPWKLLIDTDEERRMISQCNKLEKSVERTLRRASSGAFSDKHASIKQLELAAQQAELEEAKRRRQRAEHLLVKADREDVASPLEVPNTTYYGSNVQEQHNTFLQSIGDDLYGKYASNVSTKSRSKSEVRVDRITAYPTGPLMPGQQIADEVLDMLRALPKDQFLIMLENFYVGLKGRFKVPTFAHRELDLHRVWWSVMDRYGYEAVCASKQWRDVAKSLNVNLKGQTSASFNMRLNYERCLLDFENYLCCGQYEEDVADNKAPVHTHLTNPATTRFSIPGAYTEEQIRLDASKAMLERSSKEGSMDLDGAKSTGGSVGASMGTPAGATTTPKTGGLSLKLKLSVPLKSPRGSIGASGGGSDVATPSMVSPTSCKLKIKLKPPTSAAAAGGVGVAGNSDAAKGDNARSDSMSGDQP